MSQINVNAPEPVEVVDSSGDRTAAAGINLVTVLVVVVVLAVVAWYLFTGPLHGLATGSGSTNVNVTTPPATVNVNPPSAPNAPAPNAPAPNAPAPNAPAPAGNTGNTAPAGNPAPAGNTGPGAGNPAPANP